MKIAFNSLRQWISPFEERCRRDLSKASRRHLLLTSPLLALFIGIMIGIIAILSSFPTRHFHNYFEVNDAFQQVFTLITTALIAWFLFLICLMVSRSLLIRTLAVLSLVASVLLPYPLLRVTPASFVSTMSQMQQNPALLYTVTKPGSQTEAHVYELRYTDAVGVYTIVVKTPGQADQITYHSHNDPVQGGKPCKPTALQWIDETTLRVEFDKPANPSLLLTIHHEDFQKKETFHPEFYRRPQPQE